MPGPMLGTEIGLYLDGDGRLVISDKPMPHLQALTQSVSFRLNAPLEGLVTAEVEIIVTGVDIQIPLDQARFVVADEEVDGELLQEVKRVVESRRSFARG